MVADLEVSARADRLLGESRSPSARSSGPPRKSSDHLPPGWLWLWWRVVLGVADHVQDQGDRNRARPGGEKGGDGRLCRDPFPDPTIVTNFLTMAETLSSWSGSEALLALLVSTSPEHREMACPTRVPVGSPRKSAAITGFLLARPHKRLMNSIVADRLTTRASEGARRLTLHRFENVGSVVPSQWYSHF